MCHASDPKIEFQAQLDKLRAASLKLTVQREALLRVLIKNNGPVAIDAIFKSTLKLLKGKTCDLATVYRSLQLFEAAGIVVPCDFGDGIARFEIQTTVHHHHVICKTCGKTEPIDFCDMREQLAMIKRLGYNHPSHKLEFFGLCPACT